MRKSIWLLSAGLFAISTPAFAQSTDTDGQGAQPTEGSTAEAGAVSKTGVEAQTAEQTNTADVGDIVVTATRRNEALSDVPLAVSAITAQTLENSGVADIRQLTQVSPSLLVSSTSSEAGAGAARIRGIGTVGDNPGLESSVAVFIDGVYRSRTGVGLTELGQIDRIEVLRGPQGTLFGRNASAGLISIITAKPSFKQQVNAELTLGNYDLRRVEVGATGGLSDQFAVRADAIYMKRDGFLTDTISGRDVNNRDRYLVRLQGLYKPNDQFSFRLIGDYSKRDEECCAATFLRARNYTLSGGNVIETPSTIAGLERALGGVIHDDTFARDISITPGRSFRQDVKDYGVSGEAVYDFGGAELTSITAYRYNNYIRGQDADFNNLDIIYRGDDGSAYNKFKTFSQELRLQGTTLNDRLNWLVGGYFANEKLTVADNLSYGADYERYSNCLLFSSVLPGAVQTSSPTCVNQTIVNGAISTLSSQLGALLAIPVASRTPAQVAAITQLQTSVGTLGALNSVPGRPGFGSLAATLGLSPTTSFNGVGLRDVYDQNSRNFAVFTHNIFNITDSLKLTLGARYTRERKTLDATFTDNNLLCRALTSLNGTASPLAGLQALQQLPCVIPSVAGGSLSLQNGKKTESKLSGTVVLSWKPSSDILTYVSYSRGYKAGGYNLDRSAFSRTLVGTAPGGVTTAASLKQLEFKPEINDALELGMKYNGRGIDVNVAAFNQLFRDFQLNTFNGLNFFVENVNSCSKYIFNQDRDNNSATGTCAKDDLRAGVRSRGVEVEVFTRPITDVSINVGGTWTSTKYRQNLVGVEGRALSNALFQLAQRRLSNSAALALTGSASFTPQITDSGIRALFYVDARHSSQYNTGSDLDLEKLQPAYTVVNARVGLTGPKGIWGVELWAQNLFNEDFLQVAFDATLQGSGTYRAVRSGFTPTSSQLFGAFLGEPRTYGMTVRTRF
ncbi:TonB-dependent receptor [Sphingomonas astaxanthinifaciens]|uniref:TonB-dependent receptor n=1 Tax=Sphingomonas astaxanthinifaciens DSM 22298 TaxID=1123267 RepID=A0ABQ5ZAH1_9SPHN|nr:TonB-dependent receptor [Sphingomonas astaxanthinifaciens]GLR48481.1 TonB-dependent receptor [Sphingomonas astaxanthinifaciens DSM 22298]